MMKQSSLLGTFIINEKRHAKAVEASPNAGKKGNVVNPGESRQRVESDDGKTLKDADQILPKLNESKSSRQPALKETVSRKNALLNDTGENVSKNTPKSKLDSGSGCKKKCSVKLSLSSIENKTASKVSGDNVKTEDEKINQVVAYTDFLAEVAQTAKSPDRVDCKSKEATSKIEPEKGNNERSTMSYSDFLSLFKPAPKKVVALCEGTESDEFDSSETSEVDGNKKPVTQCKSILSYFSKPSAPAKSKNTPQSNSLRVIADVHSGKESVKSNSKTTVSPIKRNLSVGPTQLHDEVNTIEYLGSEMLTQAVNIEDGMCSSKKRKNNSETSPMAEPKKQKTLDIKKPSGVSIAANDCSLVSSETAQSTTKTSQSQLSFSGSGLAFSKPKVEIKSKPEPMKIENSEKRKRGRPKKVSNIIIKDNQEEMPTGSSNSNQKVSDIKDNQEEKPTDSPNPNQSMQTNSHTEVKAETPETTLRRSSRTVRPVKPFMIQEVVKIDDEDDDDEEEEREKSCGNSHGKRQRTKREKGCENEEIGAQTLKKKPKGPLAPIFTSMKPKEEVRPPPEDPEKVRLRREFMMSGIPEELKRQMVTSVSCVNVDYPPFPKPSHVQQLDGINGYHFSSCIPVRFAIGCWDAVQEPQTDHSWKNLNWDPIIVPSKVSSVQSFWACPTISESERKYLLAKWQQNDSKFNFEKMMGHFIQHLETPEQSKSNDVPSTRDTVSALPVSESSGSSPEDDVVIVDIKNEDPLKKVPSTDPSGCLWPDLHQPARSEEVIGNMAVLEQLKSWLAEWKTVMQKDIKKSRKASTVQNSKGKSDWSDDSDFTDSEEEDERLCNTMLVTGPHGVGKTAVVYALAQEIGYKVFEVNSSSLRSGKQILSQLEEATQSHRVAPSKSQNPPQNQATLISERSAGLVHGDKSSKKANSKTAASGFAALFKTSGQNTDMASNGKNFKKSKEGKQFQKAVPPKELPCVDFEDSNSQKKNTSKKKSKTADKFLGPSISSKKAGDKSGLHKADEDRSQNLACLSLILFDEVDIVFEEDKGFLSTIEYFMATTKIPIILTSTAPVSSLDLGARHDHIILKYPPMVSSVSNLCCVCLAHGIPVARRSVEKLWQLLHGDLRKCLLYLQFWCLSGGGRSCDRLVSQTEKPMSTSINVSASLSSSQDSSSSNSLDRRYQRAREASGTEDSNDCQFLSLRRQRRKGRRMILDDDEDSNSIDQIVDKEDIHCEMPGSQKRKRLSTKKSVGAVNIECKRAIQNKDSLVIEDGSSGVTDGTTCSSDVELHLGVAESALGLSRGLLSSETIGYFIQSPSMSSCEFEKALQVVSAVDLGLSCDSIYQLVLHFTSIPKCDLVNIQLTLPASQGPKRRRILERSWMDTDSSEDEAKGASKNENAEVGSDGLGQVCQRNSSEIGINSEADTKKSDEGNVAVSTVGETCIEDSKSEGSGLANVGEEEKFSNRTCLSMLTTLSQYHDAVSLIDTFQTFYSKNDIERQLSPGTSDEERAPSTSVHCFGSAISSELPGSANLLASRALYQSFESSLNAWHTQKFSCGGLDSSTWPDKLCLPICKNIPEVWDLSVNGQQKRPFDSSTKNVSNCLGAPVLQTDPVVHLDYLPYLRDICRSENARHLAKTQRRFHHYLDNAGLSLKKSTIACLTSTYTTDNSR